MIPLALLVAGALLRRLPTGWIRARWPRRSHPIDVLLIAQLLSLAIAAGRPIGPALHDVAGLLPSREAAVVDDVVVRMRTSGVAGALAATRGPLAALAGRLAQAQLSGAPPTAGIDAFVTSTRDADRFRSIEEARVVGIKLTLPLTLLLLPGFVLITIAPYVMDQLGPLIGSAR